MGRRKNDDVFVLGDELIATETTALRSADGAVPGDDQEPEGPPPSGLGHRTPPGTARSPRRLAVLGLGAAAAAALGVLELSSGSSKQPQSAETSPRSALVLPPTPGVANPPAPTGSPSLTPRQSEPSPGDLAAARRRSQIAKREQEREPMPAQAPESSPLPISTPPTAPQTPAPAPLPPSPPPPAGGGGSGGTEHFGFER